MDDVQASNVVWCCCSELATPPVALREVHLGDGKSLQGGSLPSPEWLSQRESLARPTAHWHPLSEITVQALQCKPKNGLTIRTSSVMVSQQLQSDVLEAESDIVLDPNEHVGIEAGIGINAAEFETPLVSAAAGAAAAAAAEQVGRHHLSAFVRTRASGVKPSPKHNHRVGPKLASPKLRSCQPSQSAKSRIPLAAAAHTSAGKRNLKRLAVTNKGLPPGVISLLDVAEKSGTQSVLIDEARQKLHAILHGN